MSKAVTLNKVEEMANQLSVPDRLKLISQISERLWESYFSEGDGKPPKKGLPGDPAERVKLAEVLLAECDAVAELFPGESDAVGTLRQLREERTGTR